MRQAVAPGRDRPRDETSDGSLVEITDADLDNLPLESVRAIEVLGFNPYESINPLSIGKAYYLAAHGPAAARPYALIVKALQRNSKAAIARYSLRDRERLGLLRVKDGVLVLHQLLAADEIRSPCVVAPPQGSVPDDELQSALELTDALATDDLSGLTDHYTEALEEVIHAKLDGKRPAQASEEQAPRAPAFDLMAALNESVKAARAARGETGEHATVHEIPGKRGVKKTTAATQEPAPATKQPTAKKSASGRKPHKGA